MPCLYVCAGRPSRILTGMTGTGGQRQRMGCFMVGTNRAWQHDLGILRLVERAWSVLERETGKIRRKETLVPQAVDGQESFEDSSSVVTERKPNTP